MAIYRKFFLFAAIAIANLTQVEGFFEICCDCCSSDEGEDDDVVDDKAAAAEEARKKAEEEAAEAARKKAEDDAYLASLSEKQLKEEMDRRRKAEIEKRARERQNMITKAKTIILDDPPNKDIDPLTEVLAGWYSKTAYLGREVTADIQQSTKPDFGDWKSGETRKRTVSIPQIHDQTHTIRVHYETSTLGAEEKVIVIGRGTERAKSTMFIAFRGVTTFRDLVSLLKKLTKPKEDETLYLEDKMVFVQHSDTFRKEYLELKEKLISEVEKFLKSCDTDIEKVVFCGHNVGGSVAQFASFDEELKGRLEELCSETKKEQLRSDFDPMTTRTEADLPYGTRSNSSFMKARSEPDYMNPDMMEKCGPAETDMTWPERELKETHKKEESPQQGRPVEAKCNVNTAETLVLTFRVLPVPEEVPEECRPEFTLTKLSGEGETKFSFSIPEPTKEEPRFKFQWINWARSSIRRVVGSEAWKNLVGQQKGAIKIVSEDAEVLYQVFEKKLEYNLITFGSPPVGTENYCRYWLATNNIAYRCVAGEYDLVPKIFTKGCAGLKKVFEVFQQNDTYERLVEMLDIFKNLENFEIKDKRNDSTAWTDTLIDLGSAVVVTAAADEEDRKEVGAAAAAAFAARGIARAIEDQVRWSRVHRYVDFVNERFYKHANENDKELVKTEDQLTDEEKQALAEKANSKWRAEQEAMIRAKAAAAAAAATGGYHRCRKIVTGTWQWCQKRRAKTEVPEDSAKKTVEHKTEVPEDSAKKTVEHKTEVPSEKKSLPADPANKAA